MPLQCWPKKIPNAHWMFTAIGMYYEITLNHISFWMAQTTMATIISIWVFWWAKFNWKSHINVHTYSMNVNLRCRVCPANSKSTHERKRKKEKKTSIRSLIRIFKSNKKSIYEIIFQHQINDERKTQWENRKTQWSSKNVWWTRAQMRAAPKHDWKPFCEWNHPVLSNSFQIAIDN